MSTDAEDFAQFTKDVATHRIEVRRDDGLYRHIHATKGRYCYSFDLITWPGHLCYCGDMGSYVFTRLPDMFEFFRGRRQATVDRGYLAEKAVAIDKSDGITRFSEERFRAVVKSEFDDFVVNHELSADDAADLWRDVEDTVLRYADNEHEAITAALDCQWGKHNVFPEIWEHRMTEYTTRFWWACYAIAWAIEQYDALPAAPPDLTPGATT